MRALGRLSGTVLTRDTNVGSFKPIGNGLDGSENRRDYDFTMVRIRNERLQCQRCGHRIVEQLIHLPISGNYRFAHD
jgi:hypothetical protein